MSLFAQLTLILQLISCRAKKSRRFQIFIKLTVLQKVAVKSKLVEQTNSFFYTSLLVIRACSVWKIGYFEETLSLHFLWLLSMTEKREIWNGSFLKIRTQSSIKVFKQILYWEKSMNLNLYLWKFESSTEVLSARKAGLLCCKKRPFSGIPSVKDMGQFWNFEKLN